MMTTLAPTILPSSLVGPGAGPSQPPSQSSSPASPTATFSTSQQAALAKAAHLRGHSNSASRPSTPGTSNAANGSMAGPALEPPQGTAFSDFLSSWGDAHVAKWLSNMDVHGKCAAHANAFKEADIRGNVLLELDQPTLKEIGVASIGDRIRICNAVKQLRIRCSTRHLQNSSSFGHGQGQGSSVSSVASSSGGSGAGMAQPSPKLTVTNAESSDFPRSQTHQRSRSRPAPLQLRNSDKVADLPRLIREPQGPDSARSTTPLRPLPLPNGQQVSTPNTSSSHSHSSSGSGSALNTNRTHLPPLPPPPRVQPPLPPGASRGQTHRLAALQQSSGSGGGRRTPTQETPPPHYALPPVPSSAPQNQNASSAQTPTQTQNPTLLTPGTASTTGGAWKGEYGLPARPNGARATSPLPAVGRRSPSTHTKAPSFSGSATNSGITKSAPRPNTTGSHPYGNPGLAPQGNGPNNALSPIAESFLNQSPLPTPLPPTAGSSSSSLVLVSQNPNASAYHVGRGPFRPSTPSSSAPGAPSLDDLRRKLVKFVFTDGGHTATVNVAECTDGVEILERVLKKFGKLGPGTIGDTESDEGGLCIDGWAVYLDWGQDGPAKPLREAELLSLCNAGPDHPVREHGLTVRRTGKPRRTKVLQHIFGDSPNSSTSPSTAGILSPHSPVVSTGGSQVDDAYLGSSSVAFPRAHTPNPDMRNNKRASTVSVLSGLGVRDPERFLERSGSPVATNFSPNAAAAGTDAKSPSSSSFAGKIRNFLGARPPSELIATHLPAYFPYTQPKVLRRTVRQSMRFSSSNPGGLGRRDSAISMLAAQSLGNRRLSRMSTATRSSLSAPSEHRPSSLASLPPPPVPDKNRDSTEITPPRMSVSTEDGHSIDLQSEDSHETEFSTKTTPHLLPPVNFPGESFADSFNQVTGARQGTTPAMSRTSSIASMGRRLSYMSDLRSRRDMSDTASMLTVDEITAEVELNRRKSMAASVRSGESIGMGQSVDESTEEGVSDTLVEEEEEEENFEMIGEDEGEFEEGLEEEEEDVDEEETDAEEDDAPVKSIGKRGMKWIRGALIGAGSFGSVYLGMDAMNGLLMAVKQVELPTGSGPNEQRKKSMLDALEREIDLLRELQHENIVQYLDSSSDDKHLNIFLEYVPGGSVTALLRNYGAFEEALCNHFVRQILQGLQYLHSKDIIHRDIKGANILVDNKGGIKISDFGISKKVEETFLGGANRGHRPSLQGSVYWMAPEVVKQEGHTRKADIWSVGCLVVEMLTGNHPYPTLNQMQAIFQIGMSAKPIIPADISPEAEDFLQKTFEVKHEERPDADELLQHPWIVNGPNSSNSNAKKSKGSKA